jgi:guanine deaminase
MSKYMDIAIEMALKNVEEGGTPFGALVVKGDEIVGRGVNTMHQFPDIAGHAELIAIRQAQELLGRIDLSDCVVYASGHPCPMCLGSMGMSGIKKYVYANSVQDAYDAGLHLPKNVYAYLAGDKEAIEMVVEHEIPTSDDLNPMLVWEKKKASTNQ